MNAEFIRIKDAKENPGLDGVGDVVTVCCSCDVMFLFVMFVF